MDSQETKFDESGNVVAPATEATPVAPVVEAAPVVEKPVELSEEEKADAALKARVELLKDVVKKIVADLLAGDFTLQEIGYAPDLFKTWLKIQTAGTVQHEALVKACTDANKLFGNLKSKDLTHISNVQDSQEVKA